jgi:hypothetical protein
MNFCWRGVGLRLAHTPSCSSHGLPICAVDRRAVGPVALSPSRCGRSGGSWGVPPFLISAARDGSSFLTGGINLLCLSGPDVGAVVARKK